ncbi:Alpha/Beta hydrolase protein, partial [Mycena crocata]
PIIDLGYARYQGLVNTTTNLTIFLGIRYAAAPVGELRFRAPQPPLNITEVQQATEQPNQCFQAPSGASPTNPFKTRALDIVTSEDCLFLSVSFPSDAEGAPHGSLPVIVYIHGGGYVFGASSQYRGTEVIDQSNRGVVVVIMQYRLGLFGFLSGSEVKKNGALNTGLLDQDFALRWVKKHISKFGGDPSQVTIWGTSAGAGSVLQHVIANDGQTKPQLFRGAITSSTFLPSQYKYNHRIPERMYREVVAQANCTTVADSLSCLRTADIAVLEIANIQIANSSFFGTFAWVPVVDGSFIRQSPTHSLLHRKVNGKVLLSMTNSFEGTLFVDQSTAATANAAQYSLDLFPNFGPAQAHRVAALYAGLGTPISQSSAIQGESIFICPTYMLLNAFAGRSYKGEFAIPPGGHGTDLPYYFPSIGLGFETNPFNNTAFRDAFAQSFTSFAISLDPNIKVDPTTITPKWNKWIAGQREMLFNKTEADVPVVKPIKTSNALLGRCQFWASVSHLTGQ